MNKKVLAIVAVIALVAILGVCLVACNADSYEKKLDKNGYKVQVYDKDSDVVESMNEWLEESDDYSGKIKWMITAKKLDVSLSSGVDTGYVQIIKFSKISDAKQYMEDLGAEDDDEIIVRKGNIVFTGDKDSVDLVA